MEGIGMKAHWIALALLFSLTVPLQAAVELKVETRDHSFTPPRSYFTDIVAEGRYLKLSIPAVGERDGGEMIFRADRREMIIIDHRDRSYMVMDKAAIRGLTAQLDQTRSQVEEALLNVPESQRAAMEQLLRQRVPSVQSPPRSPARVRLMADRAQVFGYPALRYEIIRDGRKIRELWATDWYNIEGGREVAQSFAELGEFSHEMTEALSSSFGGQSKAIDDGVLAALKGVDGFPVGVREYREDGSLERESALREVGQRRLAADEIEPPRGYRERQLPTSVPAGGQQSGEQQNDWDRYATPVPARIGRTQ
jgi:hypothetical protein